MQKIIIIKKLQAQRLFLNLTETACGSGKFVSENQF